MTKGKGLSPTKRVKIVMLFNELKLSEREIARHLQVEEKAVRNAIRKFENSHGSSAWFRDAKKSGRPKKLTIRDECSLMSEKDVCVRVGSRWCQCYGRQ
uniref:Uncharacterized protein n=1 Tax=Romanomermis culicivorax TaxID=13658 RepID=A0A915J8B4_ROMCU